MKRREFLSGAAAVAAAGMPRWTLGDARPCPPPSLALGGGAAVATGCELLKVPGWFANQPPGTWGTVAGGPGQRIRDALPSVLPAPPGYSPANPLGITDAWCGMAVDDRSGELLMVANGGHGDYYGNEAYGCVLRSESPAWKRLSDPTPNDRMLVSNAEAGQPPKHADGKPRASHTSGFPTFGNGRVWIPFQCGYSGGGASDYACTSWDREWAAALGADQSPISSGRSDIAPWRIHVSSLPGAIDTSRDYFGYSAYDPGSETIWSTGTAFLRYWGYDARTGAFKGRYGQMEIDPTFSIPGNPRSSGWMTIAPDLRLILVGTTGPGHVCLISLDERSPLQLPIGMKGCVAVRLTGPSNLASDWGGKTGYGGTGAVYHQASRSVYWMEPAMHGGRIRRLRIPDNPVRDSWENTWSEIAPPGGPQRSSANGIYRKFNIVDMGGEQALVCVTSIDEPVYVYRFA